MITIVDYSAGNLPSVRCAFQKLGLQVRVTSAPEIVAHARRLVLPGVGNFAQTAMLDRRGLREAIARAVTSGAAFLGICLGMQWLFAGSEEAPALKGIGAFAGYCRHFPAGVKAPHVGWNSLAFVAESRLLRGLTPGEFVYFSHSFRTEPGEGTVATSEHGAAFAAAVERDNIYGVQFHPEKSAAAGLAILRNFAELPC